MSPYEKLLDDFRKLIDAINANAASGIMTNALLIHTGRADATLRRAEQDLRRVHSTPMGHQTAWDSTSLGWLKTCPRLYEYSMVEGYTKDGEGMGLDLTFGLWYHSGLEVFYKYIAAGASPMDATREAVRHTLILSKGWDSEDTVKNRRTLIRSVVWYLDQFGIGDPASTVMLADGRPAVELSFKFEVEHGLLLCGHMDRIVDFIGDRYVMDHKTTKETLGPYYFKRYSPDNQVSLYAVAAQIAYATPVAGVIIDAAQIAVGFTRFERGFASRQKPMLDEWLDDFYIWAGLQAAFADAGHYPMNDKSCRFCDFKTVCSSSPVIRQKVLDGEFTRREWNPLIPR